MGMEWVNREAHGGSSFPYETTPKSASDAFNSQQRALALTKHLTAYINQVTSGLDRCGAFEFLILHPVGGFRWAQLMLIWNNLLNCEVQRENLKKPVRL